jgi:hypothetical protein
MGDKIGHSLTRPAYRNLVTDRKEWLPGLDSN